MNDGPIPIHRDAEPEPKAPEFEYGLAGQVFLWGLVVLVLATAAAGVVWLWQSIL